MRPVRAGGPAAVLAAAALWGSTGTAAAFAPAVAYLLYVRGLRTVPVPVAVTLGLAEPAVAALLAVLVLGERLTSTAAVGLVLLGLALAVLAVPGPPSRPQERSQPEPRQPFHDQGSGVRTPPDP